jgi:hypothetical protein
MSIRDMIWRSSDEGLRRDRESYLWAIARNEMPEMIPYWRTALELIEQEMDLRDESAGHLYRWTTPVLPDEIDVPF